VAFGSAAAPTFPHRGLDEGGEISLGQLNVVVWHTPGHTPDSISLVVSDLTRGPEPWLVMTGDSLFVGDVGRPDLGDADPAQIRAAAGDQYESVRRLMALPDFTEIYPAHYGSSPCGGLFMSRKPNSTVGYERRFNQLLAAESREAFIDQQLQLLKPPPAEAAALRAQNLGGTRIAR
jgi:glyoxylase-like metal-dependent hydrolase (beta-lactamase superfamily II)